MKNRRVRENNMNVIKTKKKVIWVLITFIMATLLYLMVYSNTKMGSNTSIENEMHSHRKDVHWDRSGLRDLASHFKLKPEYDEPNSNIDVNDHLYEVGSVDEEDNLEQGVNLYNENDPDQADDLNEDDNLGLVLESEEEVTYFTTNAGDVSEEKLNESSENTHLSNESSEELQKAVGENFESLNRTQDLLLAGKPNQTEDVDVYKEFEGDSNSTADEARVPNPELGLPIANRLTIALNDEHNLQAPGDSSAQQNSDLKESKNRFLDPNQKKIFKYGPTNNIPNLKTEISPVFQSGLVYHSNFTKAELHDGIEKPTALKEYEGELKGETKNTDTNFEKILGGSESVGDTPINDKLSIEETKLISDPKNLLPQFIPYKLDNIQSNSNDPLLSIKSLNVNFKKELEQSAVLEPPGRDASKIEVPDLQELPSNDGLESVVRSNVPSNDEQSIVLKHSADNIQYQQDSNVHEMIIPGREKLPSNDRQNIALEPSIHNPQESNVHEMEVASIQDLPSNDAQNIVQEPVVRSDFPSNEEQKFALQPSANNIHHQQESNVHEMEVASIKDLPSNDRQQIAQEPVVRSDFPSNEEQNFALQPSANNIHHQQESDVHELEVADRKESPSNDGQNIAQEPVVRSDFPSNDQQVIAIQPSADNIHYQQESDVHELEVAGRKELSPNDGQNIVQEPVVRSEFLTNDEQNIALQTSANNIHHQQESNVNEMKAAGLQELPSNDGQNIALEPVLRSNFQSNDEQNIALKPSVNHIHHQQESNVHGVQVDGLLDLPLKDGQNSALEPVLRSDFQSNDEQNIALKPSFNNIHHQQESNIQEEDVAGFPDLPSKDGQNVVLEPAVIDIPHQQENNMHASANAAIANVPVFEEQNIEVKPVDSNIPLEQANNGKAIENADTSDLQYFKKDLNSRVGSEERTANEQNPEEFIDQQLSQN